MNSFLAPNNRTSLTGVIDFTAHSIYLIQEDGTVQNILDILFPYGDIAVAELVDVQLNDLGPVIQMYQFIVDINDERAPGLESILNYINENFFNKTDPAVNGHSYYITKTFNTQYHEEHYNKHQYLTNNINNHIIKKFIFNNEQVLNIRKEYSPKINSTKYKSQIAYVENNLYKKSDNITFNNTNNIYKNINQNTTEVANTYKVNKHLKLKKT